MRRTHSVMLRLSDEEYESVVRVKPAGEELASFARKRLIDAVAMGDGDPLRRQFAFVVACLSTEIAFEDALQLYDEYVTPCRKEVTDGCGDQE